MDGHRDAQRPVLQWVALLSDHRYAATRFISWIIYADPKFWKFLVHMILRKFFLGGGGGGQGRIYILIAKLFNAALTDGKLMYRRLRVESKSH